MLGLIESHLMLGLNLITADLKSEAKSIMKELAILLLVREQVLA